MSRPDTDPYDVIISGGGPVGMGLAIDLGQRGQCVCVVERHPQPQPIPKGQNLTQRTMEHMIAWGVEPEIRASGPLPAEYGIGGMTAYGTLLSGHNYDWLNRKLVGSYYYTGNERLPQYDTERVLRTRAGQIDTVTTRYGWTVTGHTQTDEGVQVTIGQGDARESLSGRYLVGADGARSRVREDAGMTQTRRDHDKLMVLIVFTSDELNGLLERFPGKSFYNVLHPDLEGYWLFLGRVDLKGRFFFHAPVPLGTTAENFDFTAYLHQAIGAEFAVKIEHIGFWDLRIAYGDSYRAGRVFIAGDAAHSHPPYGGYGINTGFEDARNLGWKLELALKGQAGDALLDSYDAERRAVFASTAADFIEKAIDEDRDFLERHDPARDLPAFEAAWSARSDGAKSEVGAFEPHYEGSPIVTPSKGHPSAVGSHSFVARVGHHLPPRTLGGGTPVADRLSAGFTLILVQPDESTLKAAQSAVTKTPVEIELVVENNPSELRDYVARAILVRPDHFVAWAGDDLDGIDEHIRCAIGKSG